MSAHRAHLGDRGVVKASGLDAAKLIDSLISNDLDGLQTQPAIHAALLSPQGKILFAFFVVKSGNEYLLDVALAHAAALTKRLNFYKLRSDAQFIDISAEMTAAVAWGGQVPEVPRGVIAYPDPRHSDIGMRMLLPAGRMAELGKLDSSAADYTAHRIACGVPEEDRDYILGDTFPHEADFDFLHGVSFTKGCYVGQEVVSRMQNKTVVRKRVVKISGEDLATGAEIKHGEGVVGNVGSVVGSQALAMLRLDRAAEAADKGQVLTIAGKPISVDPDAIQRYQRSVRDRPVIDL